jgi:uncharacterized protein (UPF0261 family)
MPQTKVAVLSTLDSKEDVVAFFCDVVEKAGGDPWMMDLSLRPHDKQGAAVSGREIAIASGTTWDALDKMSRAEAAETMIIGATDILKQKFEAGDIGGVVGVGGANGCTMSCGMMRALPPLFPKAMVTPVAATAAVQWYVAQSDIAMYPTIGDISLNRITREAMTNAAHAIVAQAKAWRARSEDKKSHPPLIGVTSFGNLQKCVDRVTARLEDENFEVIHFHSSGPGGKALEQLSRIGELAGVIDITTSELTDLLTGGVYNAGSERLTGAGAAGLPQIVVPGALDMTNWWVGEVPKRYHDREFYQYNVEILLMRTNVEEMAMLARMIARRLNEAKGPFTVMVPTQGFCQFTDHTAHDIDGNETGPWFRPETDEVFAKVLRENLKQGDINEFDLHVNDPAFADACVDEFLRLMKSDA